MTSAKWLFCVRLSAILALLVAAALYVDYSGPSATFCNAGSGCSAVRESGFGYLRVSGRFIPLPMLGLVGYTALFLTSFVARLRALLVGLAGAIGAVSLVLLAIQAFVIGQFCSLCVLADLFGIFAALAAYGWWRAQARQPGPLQEFGLKPWALVTLALLAVAAPLLWSGFRPGDAVPGAVQRYYVPGKINVVEFADFECPFCRLLHAQLKPLLESYGERVNFVRLNMPLPSHPHARDAARSAICAELQGRGEALAEWLFSAENLSPQNIREGARELGLELGQYDQCLAENQPDERIAQESQILRDIGFEGLPTTYIGPERILGAQPPDVFRAAIERAARGAVKTSIPTPTYVALVLLLTLIVAGFGRVRKASTQAESGSAPVG